MPAGKNPLDEEVKRLKQQLEAKERIIREQAASFTEMEGSLAELSLLIPEGMDSPRPLRRGSLEDMDASHLRAMLREKNEKISLLTSEFDSHRADFRSTIDALEMASTETQRVYEKRESDLMRELRELTERIEDVDGVARQFKQLEELVQELEEGLEDARRGEAEARGEVEFLRGEVERGRSELRREREKASTAASKAAGDTTHRSPRDSREVEQRDDEIRGLKAIIHSLSSGPDLGTANGKDGKPPLQRNGTFPTTESDELNKRQAAIERLEREKKDLQGLVERKAYREEELERKIERLNQGASLDQRNSVVSNAVSDRTAIQEKRSSGREAKDTSQRWQAASPPRRRDHAALSPTFEVESKSSETSTLWCEICETGGHDILNCTNVDGSRNGADGAVQSPAASIRSGRDAVIEGLKRASASSDDADVERILGGGVNGEGDAVQAKKTSFSGGPPAAPLPNLYETGLVAGVGRSEPDPDKWCALCERDGHDVTVCPFEDTL